MTKNNKERRGSNQHLNNLKEELVETRRGSLSKKLSINSFYKSLKKLTPSRRNSAAGFFDDLSNSPAVRRERKSSLFTPANEEDLEELSDSQTLQEIEMIEDLQEEIRIDIKPELEADLIPPKVEVPDFGTDFFIEVTKAANQKLENGYSLPRMVKVPSPLCIVDPKVEKSLDDHGRAFLQSPDPTINKLDIMSLPFGIHKKNGLLAVNSTEINSCLDNIKIINETQKLLIPKKSSKRKLRQAKTSSLLDISIPSGIFSPFQPNTPPLTQEALQSEDKKLGPKLENLDNSEALVPKFIYEHNRSSMLIPSDKSVLDYDFTTRFKVYQDDFICGPISPTSYDIKSILNFQFEDIAVDGFSMLQLPIQDNPDLHSLNSDKIHNSNDNEIISSISTDIDDEFSPKVEKCKLKDEDDKNPKIYSWRASVFEAELNKCILFAPNTPDLKGLPDRFKFQQNDSKKETKLNQSSVQLGTTPTSLIPPPIFKFSGLTKLFG